MQLANHCEVCGATVDESLLGAFMRHAGGVGYVAVVECRNQRDCWARRDAKENGLAGRNSEAA